MNKELGSSTDKNKYPPCFGILDSVFPKKKNGLRITSDKCLACPHKTECLKSAMQGPGGLKVREEFVDRAYESGMIGFLERWSKKKNIDRRLKEQNAKDKKLNEKQNPTK